MLNLLACLFILSAIAADKRPGFAFTQSESAAYSEEYVYASAPGVDVQAAIDLNHEGKSIDRSDDKIAEVNSCDIPPELPWRAFSGEGLQCEYEISPILNLNIADFNFLDTPNGCLPSGFNPSGLPESRERDLCVCACLNNPNNTNAIMREQNGEFSSALKGNPELQPLSQLQSAMNKNVLRLQSVLEAEQNAMRFHGSTLPSDDNGASFLTRYFTNRETFNVGNFLESARTLAAESYATASQGLAGTSVPMAQIAPKELDAKLISEQPPQHPYCLPMRTFMTSRQLPEDESFFEDIASMASFDPAQWNYQNLRKELMLKAGKDLTTLDQALDVPEFRRVYERLQFLERNPLYKNLFSSDLPDPKNLKGALFQKIKNAYGKRSQTLDEKKEAFKTLRSETGTFFTSDPEIETMVQKGASINLGVVINEIPRRVRSVSATFDPQEMWNTAIMDFASKNNESGMALFNVAVQDNYKSDPRFYANYCPRIEFQSRVNQNRILEQLEERFAGFYTSQPEQNPEYYKMNQSVCSEMRSDEKGNRTNFWSFQSTTCSAPRNDNLCTPEGYDKLLGTFLEKFRNPIELASRGPEEVAREVRMVSSLIPLLNGESRIPKISQVDAVQSGRDGRLASFPRSADTQRRLSSVNSDFSNPDSVRQASSGQTSIANTSRSPSRTPASNSAAASSLSQSGAPESAFVPALAPVSGSAAAPAEVQRTIAQRSSEAQSIRDDIQGLQRMFERESEKPASPARTSEMDSIAARIEALETKVREKDREIARLRALPQATEDSRSNPVARNDSSDRRVESRSNIFAPTVSASVQPQANTTSGSMGSILPGSLGGNGGGSASLAPVSRGSSALNSYSALLAKYGVTSVSARGGITVANNADYQALQRDIVESPVPVTQEEYALVASNQEAAKNYLDRCPKDTDRCRLSFNVPGSAEKIEVVILMSTNEVTLVPSGAYRGIASETPSPEVTPRVNTLEYLQQVVQPR